MSGYLDIKVNIHLCGSMQMVEKTYEYVGERSELKSVVWKKSELIWRKFEDFLMEKKVNAPIALIWFKLPSEGMEKLQYVIDKDDGDLYAFVIDNREVDVYLEHECMNGGSDAKEDKDEFDTEQDRDGFDVEEDRDAYHAEDEKSLSDAEEDEEEGREEEKANDEEEYVGYDEEINDEEIPNDDMDVDDGEDVVEELGDVSADCRFKSMFEEVENTESGAVMKEDVREGTVREEKESDYSDLDYDHGTEPYPDTPVDTDEEWERLNEKPKKSKDSADQFHGDYDEEPYLWLFQKFNSRDEFKSQLLRYALKTQYDVKMAKSEGRRIYAICCEEKCKWKVLCSVEVPINKWMIKTCHNTHNHLKRSRIRLLKQGVIASLYREELRRRVYMTANEIKDSIRERYNCIVSRSKCSKAKRIALDVILEDQATQFAKLWDYESELKRSNKDITTEICTIPLRGEQVFDRFYICFEPLRTNRKRHCRPIIGLDGCFCRWDLKGELLAAVGRDADNRIYPIAWAIVRGEDNDTWAWFVSKLKLDLELQLGDNLTIISDKQKGIVNAIASELPNAEHRMCARHIYANWKKNYASSEYKVMFWSVAYSYNLGEFNDKMKLLKDFDHAAYDALLNTQPQTWSRAFFNPASQCMDVHNNLSESFNRTIREARVKPIINLLETLRRQTMDRISRRLKQCKAWDALLTPITLKVLEKSRVDGKYCATICSTKTLYEVVEFETGYTVSLSTHQCACRRWDLTGIPCKHALTVINDNDEDINKYVAQYYYSKNWTGTYTKNIGPVNGEKLWEQTGRIPIGVPDFRRPPGRPKIYRRKKEPTESKTNPGKSTRDGRTVHCSNCGEPGHNKSKCKNEKKQDQPKKKRGRPPKNPQQIHVSRPPRSACSTTSKSKNEKNATNTASETASKTALRTSKQLAKKIKLNSPASSSQPSHIGESNTSVFPAASSAPQPSVSINQPHVSKRKQPLKVRKSVQIPAGRGILHCPYTNRVFDVWGTHAKDLSGERP